MLGTYRMHALVLLGAVAAACLTGGCTTRQGPYCAWTPQYTNCGFYSVESCRAELRGADSGVCAPNPAYTDTQKSR
jgi:hypothetical protein